MAVTQKTTPSTTTSKPATTAKAAPKVETKQEVVEEDEAKEEVKENAENAAEDDNSDQNAESTDGDDEAIDMSTANDAGRKREVMPAGRYMCMITGTTFKTYKTGNKGLELKLEVSDGDYAANETRKKGLSLYFNMVVTDKNKDNLAAGLKAMGVTKEIYLSPNLTMGMLRRIADEGNYLGNTIVAQVKISVYNGDKRNEVTNIVSPSSANKVAGKGTYMNNDD
jgi:Protein of unknown function (DUF669)